MDFSSINWLAVVACVVVSMISGGLWFGPKTFFPAWWKAIGKTEKDTPGGDNMAVMWGGTVLASFVQAVSMAIMVNYMGKSSGGATLASGAVEMGVLVGFTGVAVDVTLGDSVFS